MSKCNKDLYDHDLVEKCRVCKNYSLNSNFGKNKTKKDNVSSEPNFCFKYISYNNRDRLPNNMKN